MGEESGLLLENPLWSLDGQKVVVKVTGGHLAMVDVRQGKMEVRRAVGGLPLALDPQNRYLAEGVYDESVPVSDGSPKRLEVSHLYFADLVTGEEKRWKIPKTAQDLLPSEEPCWVSDYENSVGWGGDVGSGFLFMVECGQRMGEARTGEYVFLVEGAQNRARLLWQTRKPGHITALWGPRGQRILLQAAYFGEHGGFEDGETVLLDLEGRVIKRWRGFPTATTEIVGWGEP